MATLPGRCVNELYCTVAASREVITVPGDGRYVCPNCGKTLVPPNTPLRKRASARAGYGGPSGGRASLILAVGGFAGGILLGAVLFSGGGGRVTAIATTLLTPASAQTVTYLAQPEPLPPKPVQVMPRRRHRRPESAVAAALMR